MNEEVLKEKTRTWKQENKERVCELMKSYHDTHRDEGKIKNKARYQQNRDELLEKKTRNGGKLIKTKSRNIDK